MVVGNPVDAREQQRVGVPERSRCRSQGQNGDRRFPCLVKRQHVRERSRVGNPPVKVDVVVESAVIDAAVRSLEVCERCGGFACIPAVDEATVTLTDLLGFDEEVHVEPWAEMRLGIDGVRKPGAFQEQDSYSSEAVEEHTQFGVPELLDQFRRAESLSGLLADACRDGVGASEEIRKQEVDGVGGCALPQPGEFLVGQGARQRPPGQRRTQQRIERQSGALRVHRPIVSSRSMDRLRKILRLSYRDYVILGEAIVFAIPVELGLRCVGFDRLVKHLGKVHGAWLLGAPALDGERAARLVEAVSRLYPFNPTCLKKSLVLFWMLRRRGFPAELRIGVRKPAGTLEAHAWIEHEGRVLFDEDTARQYLPMPLNT